jgi:hypothetical protein
MAIGDYSKPTYSPGETLTAAKMQAIVNKLDEVDKQTKIVLKTSNETINNSSSYQNDDKLAIALVAGKKYEIKLLLKVKAAAQTSDIKTKWTYSGTLAYSYRYGLGMDYAGTYPIGDNAMIISCDIGEDMVAGVDDTFYTYVRETLLVSVTTSGTLQLQWAQYAAVAHNSVVYAGSFIKCTEVAVT